MASPSGPPQGRPAEVILSVYVGAVVNQEADHLHIAPKSDRRHQDRPAAVSSSVNVGPVVNQQPHHFHMASISGKHQDRLAVVISSV